jgi:single-stranded DNA-specific DHH superfamily exonuclease
VKTLKTIEFQRRFEKFLQTLRFEDRIFLVFDKDVDGVTSGVITLRAFEKMGIKMAKIIPDFFVEQKIHDLKGFDAGVVVDVPTPMQEKFLRKTKKKMLVIDHHPSHDVQSKNVFYINPRLVKKEIYQPTSYTAFKLFSNYVNLKNEKWMAIVGSVGDYAFEDVKDIYKNKVKVKSKRDIWKTSYGRAATWLNAAISLYGSQKSFEILRSCSGLNSFFRNKKIENAHKKFSKEFWGANFKAEKNSEFFPYINLIFAKVDTKYRRITPALATKISSEHSNSFVVLAEKIGNKYKVHCRMQNGGVHVGEVLKNFGGGGHRNAGACIIAARYLPIFKKKLVEILKKKQ